MSKKIMILGANTLQIPLIETAKKMGFTTVVVSPVKSEAGHSIADISEICDIKDEDALLACAQRHQISGIITDQTDIAVRSVAYVAEKMGLPGIGYETACLFTDKFRMREKCKELGIPILKYKMVRSLDEALGFFEELGGHAILKPVDNQGSKGVSFIDTKEKMIERFTEAMFYSKQKEVLVEQVAHGREFVVEGLAMNGQFINLNVGDTYYFNIPDVFSANQRIFPTNANAALRKKVEEINEKIIKGFGLKQGISHSEFIMNGDDVILIETAARGGGVFISSDLIPLCTGLHTEEFLLNIATGNINKMPEIKEDQKACCYLAMFLPVGVVECIEGIENVTVLPYVHHHNLADIQIGLCTKEPKDKTARFFLIVEAQDRNKLEQRVIEIKQILNGILVRCEDGSLQHPIWA